MSTNPQVDVWGVLPASLKRAGLVAMTTLFLAGAMLYQENRPSEQPPDFTDGGLIAGDLANPAPGRDRRRDADARPETRVSVVRDADRARAGSPRRR